jgi:serine/threonine protein kinase
MVLDMPADPKRELLDQKLGELDLMWQAKCHANPPYDIGGLANFVVDGLGDEIRKSYVKGLIEIDLHNRRKKLKLHPSPGDYESAFQAIGAKTDLKAVIDTVFTECTAIPPRVHHYDVIDQIGQGGFGTVLRGKDVKTSQKVAIKIALGEEALKSVRRFIVEAAKAISMDHPNIVRTLFAGEDSHKTFAIVMDYVDGGLTLKTWLEKRKIIDFVEAAQLVRCMARALQYSHTDDGKRKGLIHRDVKPANILLEPVSSQIQKGEEDFVVELGGEQYRPKLADFGLAIDASTSSWQRDFMAGTAPYMSPEQTLGETLQSSTDVWSLGIIFYELLTGQKPFSDTVQEELFRKTREDNPRPPREINRSVPNILKEICFNCLNKAPLMRHSAEELADALEEWLASEWDGKVGTDGRPLNPYKGFESYGMNDSGLFFGRKELINKTENNLKGMSLLALVGPSGSGKSSLVQAGVLPKVSKLNWLVVPPIRLYDNPFQSLNIVIGRFLGNSVQSPDYKNQPSKFREDLLKIASEKTFVLYIDQFEELFTHSDAPTQAAFLDCLLSPWTCSETARWAEDKCKLIVTFRSEFQDSVLTCHQGLCDLLTGNRVQPFTADYDIREVIESPAKKRGVKVAPDLVHQIVTDVGKGLGNLPLLEFCLTELWDQAEPGLGDMLTLDDYNAIAGFAGVVSRHADGKLEALKNIGLEEVAKELFLQLIKVNPFDSGLDSRQPRKFKELCRIPSLGGTQNVETVLNLLTEGNARLLVRDNERVEIAHETLIKEWGLLRVWLEDVREFRKKLSRLEIYLNSGETVPDELLEEAGGWLDGPKSNSMSEETRRNIESCIAERSQKDMYLLFQARTEAIPHIWRRIRFVKKTFEIILERFFARGDEIVRTYSIPRLYDKISPCHLDRYLIDSYLKQSARWGVFEQEDPVKKRLEILGALDAAILLLERQARCREGDGKRAGKIIIHKRESLEFQFISLYGSVFVKWGRISKMPRQRFCQNPVEPSLIIAIIEVICRRVGN